MLYTYTQAHEFSRSMDITLQVFIIWKWIRLDEVKGTDSSRSRSPSLSTSTGDASSDEEDISIPEITHSVIFKCIGVHKDMEYQDTLALANRNRNDGKTVPVQLKPEPNNPYDSNAVAFVCQTDENADWKRIGYVVREVAPEVLSVINNKKLLSVKFLRIKFLP